MSYLENISIDPGVLKHDPDENPQQYPSSEDPMKKDNYLKSLATEAEDYNLRNGSEQD